MWISHLALAVSVVHHIEVVMALPLCQETRLELPKAVISVQRGNETSSHAHSNVL